MQHIAVVGGGIAGLTVALRRASAGDRVVLFEASAKVGGQLASETQGGFVIEHGAEGFVAGSAVVPKLALDAGVAEQLIDQLTHRSFQYRQNGLTLLEPGEAARRLGFQVPTEELGRGIRSFRRGMGELPEQLARILPARVEVRVRTSVASVAPRGSGVTLSTADGEHHDYDAAVVATTAHSAASLLGAAFGAAAHSLRDSAVLSSLTVSLAFGRELVAHDLDGTGFIVEAPELMRGLRAVTFASSKLANRAPPGYALFRLFFRPTDLDRQTLSDEAWAERAEHALGSALPLLGRPARAWVSRWPGALPVFDAMHRERVEVLERALSASPIKLAGAAFHGSGIDAAVRSAERLAFAVI
jgi:oxygen-dependent protoporphyrinogen oxidase